MPLYKITEAVDITDPNLSYYGCPCVIEDGVIYADVPDYAVERYIEVGRIFDVQCCADKAPEVKKTKEEPKVKKVEETPKTAEDVVDGKTEEAQEKKRKRRNKAEMAADKAAEAVATLADADDMFGL